MMLRQLCSVASLTLLLTTPISVKAQKCYGENVKPNSTVQELIEELRSDYWPRVWNAELRLESRQVEAIPVLIELARNGQFVRLRETWDLIYPGAKTFYGHGYIVDYDIDWISVRAGWVLENVTFQNFGFSEGVIDHDTMFKATLAGKADKPLQDVGKAQAKHWRPTTATSGSGSAG